MASRTITIREDVWDQSSQFAKAKNTTVSKIIQSYLTKFIADEKEHLSDSNEVMEHIRELERELMQSKAMLDKIDEGKKVAAVAGLRRSDPTYVEWLESTANKLYETCHTQERMRPSEVREIIQYKAQVKSKETSIPVNDLADDLANAYRKRETGRSR
jgi:predicted CopG family antitoxin